MVKPGAKLVFSFEVIERFARAWASIDGRLAEFDRERDLALPALPEDWEMKEVTGHYLGYMAEARELLTRAGCHVSPAPFVDEVEGVVVGRAVKI